MDSCLIERGDLAAKQVEMSGDNHYTRLLPDRPPKNPLTESIEWRAGEVISSWIVTEHIEIFMKFVGNTARSARSSR